MQKATPDQIAKAEEALHLHDPFYKQYGDYLWRLVHGDLGIAYQGTIVTPDGDRVGKPVGPAVVRAAAVTGSLVLGGALLALLISIPLGAIAAVEATLGHRPHDPRRVADRHLHPPARRRAAAAAVPRQPLGTRAGKRLLLVLRHRR